MKRSIFVCAVLVFLAACGDSDHPEPVARPSEPVLESPPRLLPEHPRAFRIELSSGACLGSCPTYSMSLDQDGYVSFVGEACLVRPGVWTRQVSREDARAMYDALWASSFDMLRDSYVSEADGCMVATDAPTSLWKVVADGKKKSLKRYYGCSGVDEDELAEVDALRSLLQQRADVLDYLQTDKTCPFYPLNRITAGDFRLLHGGVALGIVRLTAMYQAPRYFELRDCAGATLAKGDARIQGGRVILLDEDRRTIALPAELGDAASIVLELSDPTGSSREAMSLTRGRALRDDEDIAFDLSVGATCD